MKHQVVNIPKYKKEDLSLDNWCNPRQPIYMEDLFTDGIFASFDYFAHQRKPAMSQLFGT